MTKKSFTKDFFIEKTNLLIESTKKIPPVGDAPDVYICSI